MPKICYLSKNLGPAKRKLIEQANRIIADYSRSGLRLTLRQLYYQFVARDLLPNNLRSYKNLGNAVNDGRVAGMIDWNAIEDRTRSLRSGAHWDDPAHIIGAAARSFAMDKWEGQKRRVEVWIEKDALVGVIEEVCGDLDVAFFSCRGYVSQSEMWSAAMRLVQYGKAGQRPLIVHLGDHDPSGMDMSRDIFDRLELFMEAHGVEAAEVRRIALNTDQVERYDPPPNPAKVTDSRAPKYIERFGTESWELDALEPTVLIDLIRTEVESVMDKTLWNQKYDEQERHREILTKASNQWEQVADYLENGPGSPY